MPVNEEVKVFLKRKQTGTVECSMERQGIRTKEAARSGKKKDRQER